MHISDDEIKKAFYWDVNKGFMLLNKKYYKVMCIRGYALLPDLELVKDIVQDVFLSLYEKGTYSNIEKFENYLYRSVKYKCINALKRVQELGLENIPELPDDNVEVSDNRIELLHHEINKLPHACKEIFLDKVLGDRSYLEIAEEKGISINTVKTQLKRAYNVLRESASAFLYSFL